ncbi:MAG: radical SAM protein [Elusimicrobiales bacterium]|nr:radical SAM protein [Elusimicrobiales bacterium]
MKILLVQPNTRYCFNGQVNALVPVGLLYIAGALRRAGFSDIGLIDARLERLNRKELAERIKTFAPDLVGLTGMSLDSSEISVAARLAKESAPGCKVVVGGPYASSSPELVLLDPNADFAVRGEGERAACRLAAALAAGTDTSGIAGLVGKGPGGPVYGPPPEVEEDASALPRPDWGLLQLEKYFATWTRHAMNPFPKSARVLPLFTSRGCPYNCVYCHNIFGKRARLRDPEDVLDELELLVRRYGAEEIEIIDDIFNIDLDRAKRICDGIVRRGLKIALSFPNGLRADRMDEELVLKLKAAGTHLIYYAVESASPRIQLLIKKNLDLDKTAAMVRFTAAQGITVAGFFMFGFPGETRGEMLLTARFARELPFHFASFFYVSPRPNTELYVMTAGKNTSGGAANYFKFSDNFSAVPTWLFTLLVDWADYSFYLRPLQLWRMIRAVPNKPYVLKVLLRFKLLGGWS